MLRENYYVGVYWGNRPETPGDCARRTCLLLQELSRCDLAFGQWFEKGRSRADALKRPVNTDEEALGELFQKSRRRHGVGGTRGSDLGSRIGLWNGAPEGESAAISMNCGCYASTAKVWIPNTCVIDLPQEGASAERLLKVPVLLSVLGTVVMALEPEWGVVTSDAAREATLKPEPGTPLVGWITYLGVPLRSPLPLPMQSRVVPIGASGSAVVVTDELFTAENPQHVKGVDAVRAGLEKAGLMRRGE